MPSGSRRYSEAAPGSLVVGHGPAVEAPVGVAAALVHAHRRVAPDLVERPDGSVGVLQREAPLDADHGAAAAPRAQRGCDLAYVPALDRAVGAEREDVAGEHVHPAQAAPPRRPDRPLAVVGDDVGHLLDPVAHGRRPRGRRDARATSRTISRNLASVSGYARHDRDRGEDERRRHEARPPS